jgi:hypothetical protein
MLSYDCRADDENTHRLGYQLRIRQVFADNAVDLNDSQDDEKHFFRIRSALWGRHNFGTNLLVYARLNNEFRHYFHPDRDFEIHEVVFENLYLKWSNAGGLPLDFTIGRQNIRMGEGFLIMDGAPLVGSQMFYQNAFRARWRTRSEDIDIVAISNPKKDEYLPIINNQDRLLVESDEVLLGVHLSSTRPSGIRIEPYYFYKEEEPRGQNPGDLSLHTAGIRLATESGDGAESAVELAIQRGDRGGEDVVAIGGYAYAESWIGHGGKRGGQRLRIGTLYLSGPDDKSVDGWNPLLSRWPKWSELYIYTLADEGAVAYWRNLASVFAYITHPFGDRESWSLRLYSWFATGRSSISLSMWGVLGLNPQAELRFKLHPSVTGHLLAEMFAPNRSFGPDTAWFLRWQLLFDL